MKIETCVATTVGVMSLLAAQSVMHARGEYAHRTSGPASLVLTHSAISNARVILYNYVEICCTQGMKDDACVATTVRAMIPLAAQSAICQC